MSGIFNESRLIKVGTLNGYATLYYKNEAITKD